MTTNNLPDLSGKVRRLCKEYFATGGFADIYEGRLSFGAYQLPVAIKVPRCTCGNVHREDCPARNLVHEAFIHSSLYHPHILELYGTCSGKSLGLRDIMCLVSPFMTLGEAAVYAKVHPQVDKFSLLLQVSEGLLYMHSREVPVIHGDIKPSNVLVDKFGRAYVSDFGLSRFEGDQSPMREGDGAYRYMSPELMGHDEGYATVESDVYSFAMFAYEILTGQKPFSSLNVIQVIFTVAEKGKKPDKPTENVIPYEIWKLLDRCWERQPASRPSMRDIHKAFEQHAMHKRLSLDGCQKRSILNRLGTSLRPA